MSESAPLKIGINIEVEPGTFYGGVAPALRSLISALAQLTDGRERYVLITRSQAQVEWLQPLAPNQELVAHPEPEGMLRAWLKFSGRIRKELTPPRKWPEPRLSDGFFESLGCDVIHFPSQSFTYCAIPTVYNPHDLQHLHFPQFFTPSHLAWREVTYPAACRLSQCVVVNSQWVKEDVARQFAVPLDKIQVIPESAPTDFMSDVSDAAIAEAAQRHGVERGFALYPSMTWPHKNHARLLEAIALLRDRRGLKVRLVCTGSLHEPSWPALSARVAELGLGDQVKFLGFVSDEDLRCLYRLAACLVLPTLFEANSLPVFEAWAEGLPVASSNVTALPEQVGEAGLLFDPLDPADIAETLHRLLTDGDLQNDLRSKGKERLNDFSWQRTARAYRAVYRRAAGLKLSAEDSALLAWDWMRNPNRGGTQP